MRALIILALLSPLSAVAGSSDPAVWTAEACNTLELQIKESKKLIVDGMTAVNFSRPAGPVPVAGSPKILKIDLQRIALEREIEANDLRIAAYKLNCEPHSQRMLVSER